MNNNKKPHIFYYTIALLGSDSFRFAPTHFASLHSLRSDSFRFAPFASPRPV